MSFRPIFIIGVFLFFLAAPASIDAQESMKEADQLDFAQGLLSRGMYDMAILQYQKFISDYPHSPSLQEAYLSLGEGYFLSQDFDKAVDTFNQFRQLYPNSDQMPVSLLRLGQIDIQQQKYDEAIKDLTSADVQKQLKGPMLQSFDFYAARAYIGKSDTADALDYFQKATQVEGASTYTAYAFEEMGKIHAQMGQYSQALDDYAKSMQSAQDDPLKGEITYRTAEIQFLSGKYDDAIKGFEQVIDQYPHSDFIQDALANMLLAFYNLGQYDRLLSEYQKNTPMIKNDETYFAVHFAAVMAYIELKEYDQANVLLDHLLGLTSLKPQDRAKIFMKKADILIRQKKYKDGLALLDAYSSENSDNADETLFLKAQVYFGLGDYDRAFNFFENVYVNFPKSRFSTAALLGQAHARQEMGRLKESEALFLKYYNSQEESDLKSDSLYDAVMIAVKAQDIGQIISCAEEYLKKYPNGEKYSAVLIILADSYGNNNQPQDAIKLLQGYLAGAQSVQKPNSAYFLLGFYEQLSGNSDQALDAYSKVDPQKEEGKFYFAALKNMAIIYLSQKKEDQARTFFDRLISQAGQNDLQIKTYIWVCNEYIKEQKFNDALRIATQAEKNFPSQDLLEIEYFKAEALRGLDSCDEADKDYNVVLSSTVKNQYTGSAHIGYGLCLAKANKLDEAKAEFQKSLDENADDYTITVHARFEMANIDVSQGNFDDALKFYLLIATIYDDDYFCSESLWRAAQVLERLKRKDEALKLYAEILDKYKNSAAAKSAQERVNLLK
jgi:tetratricopeptide (TPR) repeat protein